ncbi:hypothetical protein POVWA2_041840 [Plasmodium ovale wallikeri]|uniref:Uncharacterized protein n=1 Tax=Plasmodium ovale wallikeri TaxID=864142 RepID=A0A1A8ZB81_PLAOA|nr:hypothetical protein POVWA1_043380 [Plasmodium ovale wallikeri]SBT41429.1 hypothetical protein POVWA2_041840 [Plasmodium ovale wallikeri]
MEERQLRQNVAQKMTLGPFPSRENLSSAKRFMGIYMWKRRNASKKRGEQSPTNAYTRATPSYKMLISFRYGSSKLRRATVFTF